MNSLFERLAFYSMIQVIGFGLIAGGLFYFTIYDDGGSIRSQIVAVQSKIQEEETKKKDTEATLQQEANMKASVGQLSTQYSEIAKRLPTTLTSTDINKSIDDFARSAGVSVKTKRPGIVVRKEIVDEVPVSVTLEGTYSELAQFVFYVSASERLTRVSNFTVVPVDGRSKKLKFDGLVVGYKIGTGDKRE